MPDTKFSLPALREHIRKYFWIYLVGIAICLIGTGVLWTTTEPRAAIDETVLVFLADGYANPEPLAPIAKDISREYDEETDESSFTLKLKDGIYFSDGEKLTVDDLIFNLYVRLQPNFTGDGTLRSLDIVGLKNYYYNNSMAESTTVSDEEVEAELANPGKETQDFIKILIRDTLQKGMEEAKRDWTSYQSLGYGNSAEEFFFKIYGIDLKYSPVGKSPEDVCEDVILSYGLDYRKLAENYAVNEHYFDERVNTYTRELILYRKMNEAGGEPVDHISGIVRLGDYTVKLRVHGKANQAVNDLFDMVIAPLHYYGDKDHVLGHVFHCNMHLPEAAKCNQDECNWFKTFLS